MVLSFQSLEKHTLDLSAYIFGTHTDKTCQAAILTNKVAHSTGESSQRRLLQWETVAEGENGISSLLIMDHNQVQDYKKV